MKTTKHIEALAEKLSSKYSSSEDIAEQLNNIKKALLTGKFYASVETVAESGMSRTINLGYVAGGRYISINNTAILDVAGVSSSGRIRGCGMDMLFAAQYNLFQALCPRHRYQDSMPSYRSL